MHLATTRSVAAAFISLFLLAACCIGGFAQSRPQRPEAAGGDKKKNQRPKPKTEEELLKEAEEKRRAEEERNATVEAGVTAIDTDIVSVDAVVYNRKTKQIITGLKKENFAIFEDGVKQPISSFSNPEAPITVTLIVEYSRWTEVFARPQSGRFGPRMAEVVYPAAQFLTQFIKPPNDYASVIAFDKRPTPITDFTNDPQRIRQTIELLLRSNPVYEENNLFDAMKFVIAGGKGDAVVLEKDYGQKDEYSGMAALKAKRRAIILIASGMDSRSATSYDGARKVIQQAGIPVYIISTGNLFLKLYEHLLPAEDDIITGMPGRLSFHQARNTLNTFAKDSGGMLFEMTFTTEAPEYLQTINGLLRNQYNLAYDLNDPHEPGKKYKLEVKVDVDGDGLYDDKQFIVQHRPFYTPTDPTAPKLKK
jgi:VWFA-related protein